MLTRYHRSAWCVVTNLEMDKILLLHKIYKDWREAWVLPKWHVENWESDEETAIREVKEETWYVDFKVLAHLCEDNFEYDNDKWHNVKTVIWYLCNLISDEKQELWLTEDEKWTFFEQIRCWLDEVVSKCTHEWEWVSVAVWIEYINNLRKND